MREKNFIETSGCSSEFNNGIWYCVQELVVTYGHPSIARQIVREAGFSKDTCKVLQEVSGEYEEEMEKFISDEIE